MRNISSYIRCSGSPKVADRSVLVNCQRRGAIGLSYSRVLFAQFTDFDLLHRYEERAPNSSRRDQNAGWSNPEKAEE